MFFISFVHASGMTEGLAKGPTMATREKFEPDTAVVQTECSNLRAINPKGIMKTTLKLL